MDLQAFDRLTLRFAWYLRPMLEAAESGGMNLDLRPTAGLDLLCRL
jgi:hypothetical protein